jgi:hypothetical protein
MPILLGSKSRNDPIPVPLRKHAKRFDWEDEFVVRIRDHAVLNNVSDDSRQSIPN